MIENETQKYDPTAAALHWIVGIVVIGLISFGKLVDVFPKSYEPFLVENHKAIGVLVFALVLVRLAWRLTHGAPPLPAGTPAMERLAAHAMHWTLYALLIILPMSGLERFPL